MYKLLGHEFLDSLSSYYGSKSTYINFREICCFGPVHLDVCFAPVHESVSHADGHNVVHVKAGISVDDQGDLNTFLNVS